MAKKPANPNTAYGRKRIREEHQQWRNNATPEERANDDATGVIIWVVVVSICLLIAFLVGGTDGALRWLTH